MANNLYSVFIKTCEEYNIAPSSWAELNGLNRTMPTNLKQGVRPSVETLKVLYSSWKSREVGMKIIAAYLKDEVERVGLSLDAIEPVIKGERPAPVIDDDLEVIAKFIENKPMRAGIHRLAELLKNSEWAETSIVKKKLSKSSAKIAGASKKR